jgi:hypothetical protein
MKTSLLVIILAFFNIAQAGSRDLELRISKLEKKVQVLEGMTENRATCIGMALKDLHVFVSEHGLSLQVDSDVTESEIKNASTVLVNCINGIKKDFPNSRFVIDTISIFPTTVSALYQSGPTRRIVLGKNATAQACYNEMFSQAIE